LARLVRSALELRVVQLDGLIRWASLHACDGDRQRVSLHVIEVELVTARLNGLGDVHNHGPSCEAIHARASRLRSKHTGPSMVIGPRFGWSNVSLRQI